MTVLCAPRTAETVSTSAVRSFRPDVEGLRAVAVLLVVLYHVGVDWLPGGYIGVDVFFVLSGFLITGLLLREAESTGSVSIGGFYARRARRILPASLLVIVATVLASWILLNFVRAAQVYADARWAAAFLANARFSSLGTDYLQSSVPPSPLQHYWSLAVEEQFYVVWPLLILLVARLVPRARVRAAVTVAVVILSGSSLAWSVVETSQAATRAYFSPATRAWELGAGALVAVCATRLSRLPAAVAPWLGWAGLGAVLAAATLFSDRTPFPGSAALLPVVGTVLVVAAGTARATGLERLLGVWPMQRLGALSFSWYLWHWPVLVIATALHGGRLPLPASAALVLGALLLSIATFHLVENPVRHSARLSSRTSNSLGFAVLALAVALFTCNVMLSNAATARDAAAAAAKARLAATSLDGPDGGATGAVDRVSAAVTASARVEQLPRDVTPPLGELTKHASPANFDGCLVYEATTRSPACRYGDTGASRTVVLFGDSHAAQWLPALDAAGSKHGFAVVLLSKALCPYPSMTVFNQVDKRSFQACDTWRSWALDRIATLHPSLVVVSSAAYGVTLPSNPHTTVGLGDAWEKGSKTTLRRLHRAASRVVLLGDAPVMSVDPAQCLADHPDRISACSQPTTQALHDTYASLQRSVAARNGTAYVDSMGWFCNEQICPMVVSGVVTHFDQWHLTADYTRLLAEPVARALKLSS